ncbi:MAG: MoaF C-terminal domain-containing protein [Solirubrobacteraceae bacterium]
MTGPTAGRGWARDRPGCGPCSPSRNTRGTHDRADAGHRPYPAVGAVRQPRRLPPRADRGAGRAHARAAPQGRIGDRRALRQRVAAELEQRRRAAVGPVGHGRLRGDRAASSGHVPGRRPAARRAHEPARRGRPRQRPRDPEPHAAGRRRPSRGHDVRPGRPRRTDPYALRAHARAGRQARPPPLQRHARVRAHLPQPPHVRPTRAGGAEAGVADVDYTDAYKLADRLYLFSWHERAQPFNGAIVLDLEAGRAAGRLFGWEAQTARALQIRTGSIATLLNETTYEGL